MKRIVCMLLLCCGCGSMPERPDFLEPTAQAPVASSSPGVSSPVPATTDTTITTTQPATETIDTTAGPSIPTAIPSASPAAEAEPAMPVVKVVINELFYDVVGSDTNGNVFAELFGTAGVDISGYQLIFVNGDDGKIYDTLTLPVGAAIGTDGFYLIADAKTGTTNISSVAGADWIVNFDPQNGPDAVQLLNAEGEYLDALGYGALALTTTSDTYPLFEGSTVPDVTNGHSLERKTAGLDTDDNLADFVDREVPTPGF